MTDYIRKDNEMFSFTSRVKDNIGASSMVDDASYIDTLKAFPQNIEIRTVRTFQRKKGGGSGLEKLLAAFFCHLYHSVDLRTEQLYAITSQGTDETEIARRPGRLLCCEL